MLYVHQVCQIADVRIEHYHMQIATGTYVALLTLLWWSAEQIDIKLANIMLDKQTC